MNKFFLFFSKALFFVIFVYLFCSFLFGGPAQISQSSLELGKEYTVSIVTPSNLLEPNTWKGEVFEISVIMPGCSVTDIEYRSERVATAKVTVLETSKYIGKHNKTTVSDDLCYGIIIATRNASIDGSIVNSDKYHYFEYTILSKPEVMNCTPKASFNGSSQRAKFVLEGRHFKKDEAIDFTIDGSNIKFRAKAESPVIAYSTKTASGSSFLPDQNVDGVLLKDGVPGGPYTITGVGKDGGKGVSFDPSTGNSGAGLFTLYPSPSITGVSNTEHYQGEESINFSIYGSGFYNDSNGTNSSYIEILNSAGNNISGAEISVSNVTNNEIAASISLSDSCDVGDNLRIRVINPDGKGGISNSNVLNDAINISSKLTPIATYNIELSPGFNSSIMLRSLETPGFGFEKYQKPEVSILGSSEGITLGDVQYIDRGRLAFSISISKNVKPGTYFLVAKNPTWKDANAVWDLNVTESSKNSLSSATINVLRSVDDAVSGTSNYDINQGTSSICYFKIADSNSATFDSKVSVTSDNSNIKFSDVFKVNDRVLSCVVAVGNETSVGKHTVLISNDDYSASTTAIINVSSSPYNRLDDSGISISTDVYLTDDVKDIKVGETRVLEFKIEKGGSLSADDKIYFEEDCEVTVPGTEGIVIGEVIRGVDKDNLLVKFTVNKDKKAVADDITVKFRNKTYGVSNTASIKVEDSDYFSPSITGLSAGEEYKYKLYRGESKDITVLGTNFSSSATFKANSGDIKISNVVVVSSTSARMRIDVSEDIYIDDDITNNNRNKFQLMVTNSDWIGRDGEAVSGSCENYFCLVSKHVLNSISPVSLAPGATYNFYLNGEGFFPNSRFCISIDGELVKHWEDVGGEEDKYIVFASSKCVSEKQVSSVIKIGTNVTSGYHDVGLYFEAIGATVTLAGVLNIPSPPIITEVANSVSQGDSKKDVVIQGRNFDSGAQVVVSGSGITISSTIVTSENSITFNCDVEQNAEVTDRELRVLNSSGLSSTATLKVVAAPTIESCNPKSVITGTSRTIEISGNSFSKYFGLEFSGNFIDISTCSVSDKADILSSTGSNNNIYLLSASYTGDTNITAEVYFGSGVISGNYDILVINYMNEEKLKEMSRGKGSGVLTIRQPLSITNEEETVPVGYTGKIITLRGTGFSSDTKVTMLDGGINIDQVEVINDKEISLTMNVSSDANIGKKRLQVKDDVTNSSARKDFINVISRVTITDVQPNLVALGVRVATVTVQGSYFDIDYDTSSVVSFEGVVGCKIINNSVIISGDGIDNLCIDTDTYNSSYMQLYMSVASTATAGVRSLTVINKDGENEAVRDAAFIVGENISIEAMQPSTFKVGANSGDVSFVITGSNFDIEDSEYEDVVENYLRFTNNSNLRFTKIKSHTDTEIQGEFNWVSNNYNNIGNRNVNIRITNKDGSIGTLNNALILSEPLGIDSVFPVVIPLGAKGLVITVKGRGFLEGIDAKFYRDSLDGSDEVRENIDVKDITVTSNNELTLRVDTTDRLPVLGSGEIKLYLQNTGGDFIETSTDSDSSLYVPFMTGAYPTIYEVEPNNVRVRGHLDNVRLTGIHLDSAVNVSFGNSLTFDITSREDKEIVGKLYATNAYSGDAVINLSTSTNAIGEAALPNKGKFRVNAAPVIDSLVPETFYKNITGSLSIYGSNFDTDALGNGVNVYIERQDKGVKIYVDTDTIVTGSNMVRINNIKFDSEGKYNIKVTNPDGSYVIKESAFDCKAANNSAAVTSLSPSFAKLGATCDVYVEGMNFMENMSIYSRGGGITVTTYTVYNSSAVFSMSVNSDANLGENTIVFANPNALVTNVSFYIVDVPVVSKVLPISLVQGTTNIVTISGSNFLEKASEFGKDFEYIEAKIIGDGISYMDIVGGDKPKKTEYNGTNNLRIKVYVDGSATKGQRDIVVSNPFSLQGIGTSLIRVVEPIIVSNIEPRVVAQGNSNKIVVIEGSGFEDGLSVEFTGHGVSVNSTKFISANKIEVVLSVSEEAESGYRGMIVTNPDTESVILENVLLIGDGIGVERAEPGKIGRGAETRVIDIIGRDFGVSTGTVKISGTGITLGEILYWDDNLIRVEVTVGREASLGSRSVTVITSDNNSGVGDGILEVVDSVVIDSMVPESITQGTSISVVIDGSGFTDTSDVEVEISDDEGIDISNITVSGDTNLLFDVYVSTYTNVGAHDIKVKTRNGIGVGKGKFVVDEFLSLSGVSHSKVSRGVDSKEIYVYGTGFNEDSELSIGGGGITINKVYYQDSKKLKAVITISLEATLGDREVVVRNNNGTGVSMTGIFEVVKEIKVDSITPSRIGIGMKGVEVKIKGAEFKEGADLSFSSSDIEVVSYTVDNSNLITAVLNVSDSVNEGNYNIVVTNSDGNYGRNQGGLIIYEKVKVEKVIGSDDLADYFVLPREGTGITRINKTLSISGSGFEEGENREVPEVIFSLSGIVVDRVYFISSNEISCDVTIDCSNMKSGVVTDVTVRNVDGSIGRGVGVYFAISPLKLSKIAPKRLSQGASGVSFGIVGEGFVEDGINVVFSDSYRDTLIIKSINYQSEKSLQLILDVLSDAIANEPVNFYIENKNGDIVYSSDVFMGDEALQINNAPVIKEVEPSSLQQGATNQVLKIIGNSFLPDSWKRTIIDDIKGVIIETFTFTNEEIDMVVNVKRNADVGSRNIKVKTIRASKEQGGSDIETEGVGEGLFSITTSPVVTSVSSNILFLDREYTDFTMYGDGFREDCVIEFSDSRIGIDKVRINSQKSITMNLIVSEEVNVGQVDVTITNGNGSVGTSRGIFEVMEKPIPPSFTSISMTTLPINQKNWVKISGSNLQDGITVDFRNEGIVVSSLNWINNNEIKIEIEVGSEVALGKYNLVLTNPDGGELIFKNAIEVIGGAKIESIDPGIILKDIEGNRVVNIVIRGSNFSDNIDPNTIRIDGEGISVLGETFKFTSTKEISVDIDISSSVLVGVKGLEFLNGNTGYYTRINAGIEIVEEVVPKIDTISPDKVMQGVGTAILTVRGEDFREGIKVESRISGISVTTVTYNSHNEVEVEVSITDTEVGGYSLFFKNPYGAEVEVENAVVVLAYPVIERVEPSEIVMDGENDSVVHLVVSGNNFYEGMDPDKIKIQSGNNIKVDTGTFRYNGRTNISFDVLVSRDVDEGDYDIEIDNLSGVVGIGKGMIKVVYDSSNLIRNVSISSEKIVTDKGDSSRVYFYFTLKESCIVELLVYLSTETFTYNEMNKVQEINYLTAGKYERGNSKIYWDGRYPGTNRKINGSYNFIIRATSIKDNSHVDYYVTRDTKKSYVLSEGVSKLSESGENSALTVDVYNISSIEVIYNSGSNSSADNSEGGSANARNVDGNIYPYTVHYTLSKAFNVKISLIDNTGLVVRSVTRSGIIGDNYWDWDGKGDDGEYVNKGSYDIRIEYAGGGDISDDEIPEPKVLSGGIGVVNEEMDIDERRRYFEKNMYPYPNPVNPNKHSNVKFSFWMEREGSVNCYVYDTVGQIVWKGSKYNKENRSKKDYIEWNLKGRSGRSIARGLYIVVMEAKETGTGYMLKSTKKMMVIK